VTFADTVGAALPDLNGLWVDSRLRALAQRRLEAPALRALEGSGPIGRALELGCGRRGSGLRLARELFGAGEVVGVDLHEASAQQARSATADLPDITVEVADARALRFPDASFDAVFAYHVLHHTPDWRGAVAEAARVLRPGGRLLSCEMTARFVDSAVLRAVSRHPRDDDRPTPDSLAAAVRAAGLTVVGQQTRYRGWWTALVAVRP